MQYNKINDLFLLRVKVNKTGIPGTAEVEAENTMTTGRADTMAERDGKAEPRADKAGRMAGDRAGPAVDRSRPPGMGIMARGSNQACLKQKMFG